MELFNKYRKIISKYILGFDDSIPIYISSFDTNLGEIEISINSSENIKLEKNGDNYYCKTKSFDIEIIEFNNIKDWWDVTDFKIESSIGWIIRIIKIKKTNAKLNFQCVLAKNSKSVTSDCDPGDSLLAILFGNKEYEVGIGTEDGEEMKKRADKDDWMPSRFKDYLGYFPKGDYHGYGTFSRLMHYGIKTEIPNLKKGEKFYFHYLVSTNIKNGVDYTENAVNFTVDYPKSTLIEKLNIDE